MGTVCVLKKKKSFSYAAPVLPQGRQSQLKAGLLTYSSSRQPSHPFRQWLKDDRVTSVRDGRGNYSSGNCPGFSPGSLLIPPPQSGGTETFSGANVGIFLNNPNYVCLMLLSESCILICQKILSCDGARLGHHSEGYPAVKQLSSGESRQGLVEMQLLYHRTGEIPGCRPHLPHRSHQCPGLPRLLPRVPAERIIDVFKSIQFFKNV